MNDYENRTVPYLVYEHTTARFERIIKRLLIVMLIMAVSFSAYIVYDKYEDSQYDYAEITVDSTDGGTSNYLKAGQNGVIANGEGSSKDKDAKE